MRKTGQFILTFKTHFCESATHLKQQIFSIALEAYSRLLHAMVPDTFSKNMSYQSDNVFIIITREQINKKGATFVLVIDNKIYRFFAQNTKKNGNTFKGETVRFDAEHCRARKKDLSKFNAKLVSPILFVWRTKDKISII